MSQQINKKPIILIVGPTASGKSDLAVFLAKKINGECINADATQFFQGLDIATNKITFAEQQGVPHHMLSFLDLKDKYSISDYQKQGRNVIEKIFNADKVPIIVGGSGLYINALLKNYQFWDDANHHELIDNDIKNYTNQALWEKLYYLDPIESKKIHPNNRRRVLRAITICLQSGQKKSATDNAQSMWFYSQPHIIGLSPDRERLHHRIVTRVDKLVVRGLFEEVISAFQYCNENDAYQSMKIIGCSEIIKYYHKSITFQETIEKMIISNRQYARKQMTWFNHQLCSINWYHHRYDDFLEICEKIYKDILVKNIL